MSWRGMFLQVEEDGTLRIFPPDGPLRVDNKVLEVFNGTVRMCSVLRGRWRRARATSRGGGQ
jgi:hypothetical protein